MPNEVDLEIVNDLLVKQGIVAADLSDAQLDALHTRAFKANEKGGSVTVPGALIVAMIDELRRRRTAKRRPTP
jgi:hypothetical protein